MIFRGTATDMEGMEEREARLEGEAILQTEECLL